MSLTGGAFLTASATVFPDARTFRIKWASITDCSIEVPTRQLRRICSTSKVGFGSARGVSEGGYLTELITELNRILNRFNGLLESGMGRCIPVSGGRPALPSNDCAVGLRSGCMNECAASCGEPEIDPRRTGTSRQIALHRVCVRLTGALGQPTDTVVDAATALGLERRTPAITWAFAYDLRAHP